MATGSRQTKPAGAAARPGRKPRSGSTPARAAARPATPAPAAPSRPRATREVYYTKRSTRDLGFYGVCILILMDEIRHLF
jgi:hypothetical protein